MKILDKILPWRKALNEKDKRIQQLESSFRSLHRAYLLEVASRIQATSFESSPGHRGVEEVPNGIDPCSYCKHMCENTCLGNIDVCVDNDYISFSNSASGVNKGGELG